MTARTASRERPARSFWFDPRFAIGVGLVVASVFGVIGIVSASDSSTRVLAARAALSPGDRITADDLVVRNVRLGDLGSRYLVASELPPAGVVVTRTVAAGELVPASAVGSSAGIRLVSVVVSVKGELARSIGAGSQVDLWSASKGEEQSFDPPSVLVSSATVVRVIEQEGIVADRATKSVELLVPRSATARVLAAIADDDAVSLVPVDIPLRTEE